MMLYIIGGLALFVVLGLGFACALDDQLDIPGWKDANPYLRVVLPLLYLVIAAYGVMRLVTKVLPRHAPDWLIYVWVMLLGGNYHIEARAAEFVFQVYQRPHRGKPWKRKLAAHIIRLNRSRWNQSA